MQVQIRAYTTQIKQQPRVKWVKRCELLSETETSKKLKSYYANYGAAKYIDFANIVKTQSQLKKALNEKKNHMSNCNKDCASGAGIPGKITSTTPRTWTPSDEDLLMAMHVAQTSVKHMSIQLNRTTGAIQQKLYQLQKAEEEILDPLTCPVCKNTFTTRKGMKIHFGKAHKAKEDEQKEKEKPHKKDVNKNPKKRPRPMDMAIATNNRDTKRRKVEIVDIIEILDHKLNDSDGEISFNVRVEIPGYPNRLEVKWLKRCELIRVKSKKYESYYANYGVSTYNEFVEVVNLYKSLKPAPSNPSIQHDEKKKDMSNNTTSTAPRRWKPYEEDRLPCPECKKTFTTEKGMKIHFGKAHKAKENEEKEKPNITNTQAQEQKVESPEVNKDQPKPSCPSTNRKAKRYVSEM
eukprot:909351_1